jgi:sensor histidine kinase regulating citrate/malate metabolism
VEKENTVFRKFEEKQKSLFIFPLLTKLVVVMLVILGGILSFTIYQESKLELESTLNILEQVGSRLIYQIESFKEVLSFLKERDEKKQAILQSKLMELMKNENYIFYIHLVDKRGEIVMETGYSSPSSFSDDNHIMFSLQNDQEITHTYEDAENNNLIFEIIAPIEVSQGRFKGEIIGALRLGLLLDKVRSQIKETRKDNFYDLSIFIIILLISSH